MCLKKMSSLFILLHFLLMFVGFLVSLNASFLECFDKSDKYMESYWNSSAVRVNVPHHVVLLIAAQHEQF